MKQRYGFTLAETLIAFGIISVLVSAALLTLKPFDRNIRFLYSSTYYSLDKALYNGITYWVPKDRTNRDPFRVEDDGDTPHNGTERLCNVLTEYINAIESDSDRCKANAITDDTTDSSFTSDKVQFTATNGVRYWISNRYPNDDSDGERFYIIYADMNGVKSPNSLTYVSGSIDPDIFAFAALESGRICPLGPPEVDQRYLSTRIIYRDISDNKPDYAKYSEPSQEYVLSKAQAWGYYVNTANIPNMPESPEGQTPSDEQYMEEAPLSYNDYIRSKISSSSKIYSFLGNQDMAAYVNSKFDNVTIKSNDPDAATDKGYGCIWRSEDDCKVIVDKYVW